MKLQTKTLRDLQEWLEETPEKPMHYPPSIMWQTIGDLGLLLLAFAAIFLWLAIT